jgi:putative sterol carrier protein
MSNKTVKEMFDEMRAGLEANTDKFADLNGTMQFDFTADNNGYWYVQFGHGKAVVGSGIIENATFTLITEYNLFKDLHTGKISHDEFQATGKIKTKGDANFASKAGATLYYCSKYSA